MLEKMPDDLLDRMPEDMPENMPDRMLENMPDSMPEGMPDRRLDRMPEGMPDEVQEYAAHYNFEVSSCEWPKHAKTHFLSKRPAG